MAKWISKIVKGKGRVLIPANPAAELAQKHKDKQDKLITADELKAAKAQEQGRIEAAEAKERLQVAAEVKERMERAAKAYVPPTPRPGANAKFRERNARVKANG